MSKILFAKNGDSLLRCVFSETETGREGSSLSICQVPMKSYPLKK